MSGAGPGLLAVAHGSRDPRHAAALHGLLREVRRAAPGLRAELAFLDLCGPDPAAGLARLAAAGAREVVVVPLFLGRGYHVRHDIPAATAHALRTLRHPPRLTVADPLGPDPLVLDALDRRLREQDVWPADPELGLVVASATSPPAADQIAALRSQGWRELAVASYFLAPGLLYDRARADATAAGVPVAAPLTTPDDPPPAELVRLVLSRGARERAAPPCGKRPVSTDRPARRRRVGVSPDLTRPR